MARTVDELLIKIKADTKELEKKLKNIKGELDITGKSGVAAFGGAGLAGALSKIPKSAIAATAALAGLGMAVSGIARVGAGFEDLKDSLDTVFGSVSAGDEAMQKVFKFAQTTPFQIEDVTSAFIQLKAVGVEPSMNMLQTFADVASTSIDQLGAFQSLVRITQRAASGGLGLEELNQLDERGIPAIKILTTELNMSKEELTKFGKTADGARIMMETFIAALEKDFGGAMASKMDNLSTKTSNMTIAFRQLADAVFKSGLGNFLKDIADQLTAMATAAGFLIRKFAGNQNIIDVTGETDPQKQFDELKRLRQIQVDIRNFQLEQREKGFGTFAQENKALAEIQFLDNLIVELGKTIFGIPDLNETFKLDDDVVEFMPRLNKLLGKTADQAKIIQDEIDLVNKIIQSPETMEALKTNKEELEKIVTLLNSELSNVGKEGGNTIEALEALNQVVIESVNAFSTDFVNALMSGQDALRSFKDFSKSLVSQIISTFFQLGVVNEILMAIFGGTGLDLPTLSKSKRNKAGGGTIQRNTPTLVGERGAEIFVPNTGGTILNNMNSKNAMGGQAVNIYQNVNFSTGIVPTVRAEVMSMLPQIAEVTKGAVQESAMRGGSFRRSLIGG